MSATVIPFNSVRHKPTPQKSTTIVLDIDDFENIELAIDGARSAMLLAMKAGIDGFFRPDIIGEAFLDVFRTIENVCSLVKEAKGIET